MKKQKAIISYIHVRDNDLTEVSQLIINKLTGNTYFPNPPVTLATVQTATDDYSTALVQAKDGTKADTENKNVKRKVLEGYLSQLADYVNDTAMGDLLMLETSGCPLTKVPEPVGILPAPESFEVSVTDNQGQAAVKIGIVDRASGYLVLYYVEEDYDSEPPDSKWQRKVLDKTTGLITGLPSGKKVIFKAAARSSEADERELYNFTEDVDRYIQ